MKSSITRRWLTLAATVTLLLTFALPIATYAQSNLPTKLSSNNGSPHASATGTASPQTRQTPGKGQQNTSTTATVTINGTQPWTDTSIDLVSGNSVTITASGTIYFAAGPALPYGPDGNTGCTAGSDFTAPGLHCFSLVANIANGTPFQAGSSTSFPAITSGRLFLGVNDNVFTDNSGSWSATVTVTTAVSSITITSTSGWQQTSLTVQQGSRFTVSYLSGTWTVDYRSISSVGPQGYTWDVDQQIFQGCKYDNTLTYATLLGQIGNGSDFAVGKGGILVANASGTLSLRINDNDACLVDNAGSVTMSVLGTASGTDINVDGTQPWTDTGIDLVSGNSVSIRASGVVWMADGPAVPYNADGNSSCTADSSYPAPGLYCYSLIGRIGSSGIPFQLGSSTGFKALFSGRLYLGVNDNVFSDNHSAWQANIVIPTTSTSPNWSGYEVYGPSSHTQTFSAVQGSWKQPKALSCSTNENSKAYFWVGLGDAFINSQALEQIGTFIQCVKGALHYHAFYEFYPSGPVVIINAFTPKFNDLITAIVSVVGQNLYALKIIDITQNKRFNHTFTVTGGETNSAEWVAENSPDGTTLTKFGKITFSNCTVDGYSIISGQTVNEVTLQRSFIEAVPSALYTGDGKTFDVTWLHH